MFLAIIVIIAIILYILSWWHAIFRLSTGGRPGSTYDTYLCDKKVLADKYSALIIAIGTVLLIFIGYALLN